MSNVAASCAEEIVYSREGLTVSQSGVRIDGADYPAGSIRSVRIESRIDREFVASICGAGAAFGLIGIALLFWGFPWFGIITLGIGVVLFALPFTVSRERVLVLNVGAGEIVALRTEDVAELERARIAIEDAAHPS